MRTHLTPHAFVVGSVLLLTGVGFALNSPVIGSILGRLTAFAMEPLPVVAALIIGFSLRRYSYMLIASIVLGAGVSLWIGASVAEQRHLLGLKPLGTMDQLGIRLYAFAIIAHVANAARLLLRIDSPVAP